MCSRTQRSATGIAPRPCSNEKMMSSAHASRSTPGSEIVSTIVGSPLRNTAERRGVFSCTPSPQMNHRRSRGQTNKPAKSSSHAADSFRRDSTDSGSGLANSCTTPERGGTSKSENRAARPSSLVREAKKAVSSSSSNARSSSASLFIRSSSPMRAHRPPRFKACRISPACADGSLSDESNTMQSYHTKHRDELRYIQSRHSRSPAPPCRSVPVTARV
jgi:hypothetical protein